jgi:hypothetical protein
MSGIFPVSVVLSAPDGSVLGRHSIGNDEEADKVIVAAHLCHGKDIRVEYELNERQRIYLMGEVYGAVEQSVESFEHDDMVGPDLAYLLGAMLNDTYCGWPEGRPIIGILRANFPPSHPVFSFVQTEEE